MTKRQKRASILLLLLCGVALVVYLGVKTFQSNLLYFFSPTDVVEGKVRTAGSFKLGGLVKEGSVIKDGLTTTFTLSDNANEFVVKYTGILPDLFREGQGIIATGKLQDNTFVTSELLAKHDENYMPPEVAAALAKQHAKKQVKQQENYTEGKAAPETNEEVNY